jgi:hypothetical protein
VVSRSLTAQKLLKPRKTSKGRVKLYIICKSGARRNKNKRRESVCVRERERERRQKERKWIIKFDGKIFFRLS